MMISLPIWLVVVLGLGWIITLTYVIEFRARWHVAEQERDIWLNAFNKVEKMAKEYAQRRDAWIARETADFMGLTEADLPPVLSLRNRTVTLPRERKEALDRMTSEAVAKGLYDRHPDYEVQPPEDNDGA